MQPDYRVNDPDALLSPSLLIFRDIVVHNLHEMIRLARGAERLRPHVKTHKMPRLVALCEQLGIHKHKCATIAEAEMTAAAGGQDVLLAYPLVGPNIRRFVRLATAYPETTFRVLVDEPLPARALSAALAETELSVPVLIDLEVGMGRTGTAPDDAALALCELVDGLPHLEFEGISAYDGQIHDSDLAQRRRAAETGIAQTLAFRERLLAKGLNVHRLVLGGTPTFPIHAELDVPGVECSPGTCTIQDVGYANRHPDLPFIPGAALLTRVISRPRPGRLCLDLGHKAVAADPPAGSRLTIPELPEAHIGGQSEEHLVVDTPRASEFPPGTALLAFPSHICPTCALHRRVYVMEHGDLVDEWEVAARDRVLTV
ncbi:MAG: D-TA family PLP-dependent enzyme [Isosphaeraceae bacterium]|nr:D-TA family PLP-dependent enzyme [Isosphaeraceae bacterium]